MVLISVLPTGGVGEWTLTVSRTVKYPFLFDDFPIQLIKSLPLVPDPMDWSGFNFRTLRLSVWTLETESRAIKTLQKEKQEVIKAAEIESFDACKTKTLFGELEAGSTVDENFPAAIFLSRKHFAWLDAGWYCCLVHDVQYISLKQCNGKASPSLDLHSKSRKT